MFCAALLLSCPCVEISIYSTCKRISQKILRNVFKFAMMIADQDMATINCAILRENMEEIYLRGPLGSTDVRIINSYPSKVSGANARAKVAPNVAPAPRQKSRPRRAAPRKSPCTHRAPAPKACPAGSLAASCGHASRSPSSLARMASRLLCCRRQAEACRLRRHGDRSIAVEKADLCDVRIRLHGGLRQWL